MWRRKIEAVLNTADTVITVSSSNKACIDRLDVHVPVLIIPNGFRSELFHPQDKDACRQALDLPLDKSIVLTVGYLEHKKGHRYLIDAMAMAREVRDDLLAIIVGSGELRGQLERQIRRLDLQDCVKLVGGRPHAEVPLWMNACDLFVLPSLKESFGVVQIALAACGLWSRPSTAVVKRSSFPVIMECCCNLQMQRC